MPAGKVKWFNNAKGYGFIVTEAASEDVFAHYSAILMDGYKTLKAGQPVAFETMRAERGLHAVNIRPCQTEAEALAAASGEVQPDATAETTGNQPLGSTSRS